MTNTYHTVVHHNIHHQVRHSGNTVHVALDSAQNLPEQRPLSLKDYVSTEQWKSLRDAQAALYNEYNKERWGQIWKGMRDCILAPIGSGLGACYIIGLSAGWGFAIGTGVFIGGLFLNRDTSAGNLSRKYLEKLNRETARIMGEDKLQFQLVDSDSFGSDLLVVHA